MMEMMETKDAVKQLFRLLRGGFVAILILWLLIYTFDELTKEEPVKVSNGLESWEGYDPSKPAGEIKHLDYMNKRITYRTYLQPGEKLPPSIYEKQAAKRKAFKKRNMEDEIEDYLHSTDEWYEYYIDFHEEDIDF